MQLRERFESKIRVTPGCWHWTAAALPRGYGRFGLPNRKVALAHRMSYELYVGSIPDGMVVRHRCDTPSCVNPDHLELGTQADNVADMMLRGRHGQSAKTHCPKGHEYTEENTYRHKGGRWCRACDKRRRLA